MKNNLLYKTLVSVFVASCLSVGAQHSPGRQFPFPSENKTVEEAVATANLEAAAAATTDPDVWLGLALFPQPGDPMRKKLVEIAADKKPEYAGVAVVLTNAMDGVDEQSIAELIKCDSDNALGYYMLGTRLLKPGHEKEALEAFRKAAACPDLRVYGSTIATTLFKALDTLNLKGVDRLNASSWVATRWQNFAIINLQSQPHVLKQLAQDDDLDSQKELSDLMLVMAGHFIASDLTLGRAFGERALLGAFRMKADIAASEKSPTANGYAGVVQALVSTKLRPVGSNLWRVVESPSTFLAGRIQMATLFAGGGVPKYLRDREAQISNAQQPQFAAAKDLVSKTAQVLIAEALPDQDEIIRACFGGHLPPPTDAPAAWVTGPTYLERLMITKPSLFAALEKFEDARLALDRVGQAGLPGNMGSGIVKTPKDECVASLRSIDGAKQQWALEMGKQITDRPSLSDLQPYLGQVIPKCPSGGVYTIGSIGTKPTCSIAEHVCP